MTSNDMPSFLDDNSGQVPAGSAPSAPSNSEPAPSRREVKAAEKAQVQAEKAQAKAERSAESGSLAWISLLAGIVVICWQAIFGYRTVGLPAADSLHTLSNMGAIMLGLATLVLGIVALAQRRKPSWPAIAASAIGLQAFAVGIVTWMATL